MSVKRAHVLQHVVFEGPGHIADWLSAQGAEVTTTAWYSGELSLPDLDDIDLLLCLGGPMSVHDNEQFPWLANERAYLQEAIARGVPTLGVCLGAQQMALCMGADVTKNPVREIGWYPLVATDAAADVPAVWDDLCVLHWHSETFSLPAGAQWLAGSAACATQAVLMGPRALALQCHLEITAAGLEALTLQCADELTKKGPSVQAAETLLQWPSATYHEMHDALTKLLSWLTSPTQ